MNPGHSTCIFNKLFSCFNISFIDVKLVTSSFSVSRADPRVWTCAVKPTLSLAEHSRSNGRVRQRGVLVIRTFSILQILPTMSNVPRTACCFLPLANLSPFAYLGPNEIGPLSAPPYPASRQSSVSYRTQGEREPSSAEYSRCVR